LAHFFVAFVDAFVITQGFVHYPSIWHLAVTSESLNERFNDIRDVCSTFYNRDDTHKPSQYGAIITALPFTLLNHLATYAVASCCCLVQAFSECKGFILKSSRRRKGTADPPQNLNIVESLSSSSGVALEENTVIMRAVGITLVIAGLSFLRLLGGVRYTALTTVLFLVNQHLYNALLFRKPFLGFLLSIVFGNLFVIQRVKQQSKKEENNGVLTDSENNDTDEEMGLARDDASKTLEADIKNDGSEMGDNSIVQPEESLPEIRNHDFVPWGSEQGGEIKETWGFARQKARKAGIPLEIHQVEPQQSSPKSDSKSPTAFDICLDNEKHPGTIAWRQAVRRVAEEGSKSKYSLGTRQDLKKLLKGRQYFVRCPPSISASTWRKASMIEVGKRSKQCFEEEMRKIELETMLKEELENTPKDEDSVQKEKPRMTHDWAGSKFNRTIAGSPSKDNSLLLELLQTFTESVEGVADNKNNTINNNNNYNNSNKNTEHQSTNGHGVASSLSAGTFSKDASQYETATATSFSLVTPIFSFPTFGTDIYEQQPRQGMETTKKWGVGGDDQSYILENVGNSDTLSTADDGDTLALDTLFTVDTMCSGPQRSFDIAQRYFDAMDQSLGSPTNVGSTDDLDVGLILQTSTCDTMKSFKTVATAPLRAVSSNDVEEQKKKRLVLQREQIVIMRQREAQRKRDKEKELSARQIKESGDNNRIFSFLHWNPVSKRRKMREIEECKRNGAINLLIEMSELEGRMDSDSAGAEEEETMREAAADSTPTSRSVDDMMTEGGVPSPNSLDFVTHILPAQIQESRQNGFVIGRLRDDTKATEDETHETLDPEQLVVDPTQPTSTLERRDSSLCNVHVFTAGDSEPHFSSVYRKMKRDLESKHFKGRNKNRKNDTSAKMIPGLDVSPLPPLPPLGPPTTVIAQIVPRPRKGDDYSELTFDTASRISCSSDDRSLPGCDYGFGL
jgi:hypothetical protein